MSLLTPDAVAKRLGVSAAIARRLMRTGRIPSENIGVGTREEWRTTEEWVTGWLQSFGGSTFGPPSAKPAVTIEAGATETGSDLRIIPSARHNGRRTNAR